MTRMTLMNQHFRLTASEIAMGRVMRAPDHPAGDEFGAAFADFAKDEPAAGAADDKGGAGDGDGGASGAPAAGGPDPAAGGGGDGTGSGEAGGGAPPPPPPAGEGEQGGAPAPAAGDGAGEAGAAGGAPAADDKGGKGAAPPPPPAAQAGETDEDVLKRLAAAVKKVGADEAPPPPPAAQEETPLFTAEEQGKIEHFRKEWPEVAEAFDLQARALAQSVIKYAFEQIGSVVNPMRETVDNIAARMHYGDLTDKVGTYTAEEVEEIKDWVGKHPTYLQKPMLDVIDAGTAEEVADLVGRYRKETGKQPAGAQAETPAPPGGDVELSDAAKQAAAGLAPVNTKRTAVQAPDDKSDFGAAFAKFADEIG